MISDPAITNKLVSNTDNDVAVEPVIDDTVVENAANAARRRFLQRVGVVGVAALGGPSFIAENSSLAVTVFTSAVAKEKSTSGASAEHRWGLLIDTSKCASGCDACVRGCHEEHGIRSSGNDHTDAQWIRKVDLKDNLSAKESSLPLMCQHCDSAPCVDVCPTGASFKRADGVVLVNKHTCIGCRYCVMACPYKARSFIHETITDQLPRAPRGKGTVEGCTLCVHRIDSDKDLQPACADACTRDAHDAIVFGDLNDPKSRISRLMRQHDDQPIRADLRLNTGVRYTNL